MKKNYNLDDLESFLSDSAEQHRMYPSDRVWRNIDQELHGRKSWPALTFGAILTGAIITAGLILIHPDKSLLTATVPAQSSITSTNAEEQNRVAITSPAEQGSNLTGSGETPGVISTPFYSSSGINPVNHSKNTVDLVSDKATTAAEPVIGTYSSASPVSGSFRAEQVPDPGNVTTEEHVEKRLSRLAASAGIPQPLAYESFQASAPVLLFPNSAGEGLSVSDLRVNESVIKTIDKTSPSTGVRKAVRNKANRWNLVIYATPSISYRRLSEAKIVDLHLQNNGGPIAPNLTHGVNNFVNHRPIAGYEIGAGIMYDLTPSLRIKSGLQFNLRGYSIQAYAAKRETSTILLNRGYYTDSLVSISTIGTQDGYKSKEVDNRYFEISVPLGLDMKVADWKKIQLYVAAGIQPTYQFNNSMYMISNDYKKYVQEPDLARHWNVNSSIEAFLSYKAAGVTWQAGPQIRYQLLPGAINQYPVKERLVDYGLKIGVVKTLQ